MKEKKTFLGLVNIIRELLKQEILQYDPNNRNNMLVYYSGDSLQPEGWYSTNILQATSDLFHDKNQMAYVLQVAQNNGIDTERYFKEANEMLL